MESRTGRRAKIVRWGIVAALLVVLVTGPAVHSAVRWWTHPDLFENRGDGFAADPLPVDKAVLSLPITRRIADVPSSIRFRSASAHLRIDTARVAVTFRICSPSIGDPDFLVATGGLGEFCPRLRPLTDGSTLRPDQGEYVVMTLTATQPGRAVVDRVDLDYALGRDSLWRRGVDTVRVHLELTAR